MLYLNFEHVRVARLIGCCSRLLLVSTAMRAPALLAQCLPGLVPHDRGSLSISSVPEKDLHLPSPAVEILPSKVQFLFLESAILSPEPLNSLKNVVVKKCGADLNLLCFAGSSP